MFGLVVSGGEYSGGIGCVSGEGGSGGEVSVGVCTWLGSVVFELRSQEGFVTGLVAAKFGGK